MESVYNGDREFNPYYDFVVEEAHEEFEDILPEPPQQVDDIGYEWPCPQKDTRIDVSRVLDGVLVIGKSWDIVKIDGVQRLQRFPTLFSRTPSAYKGLGGYLLEYKHIFEFQLLMVNDLTLCLLVCTKQKLRSVKGINPPQLIEACREEIRSAIRDLDETNSTRISVELNLDGHIAIHSEDWDLVAPKFQQRLSSISSKGGSSTTFPPLPEFWFIAKRFGQDISYGGPNSIRCLESIRPRKSHAVVVHCAFDHKIRNTILWWQTEKLRTTMCRAPNGGFYRVGIYPGLGNGIFETRKSLIPLITYYTRIFHQIHRDELGLFWSNDITILMANIFATFLKRTSVKGNKLSQKVRVLKENKLTEMIRNMSEFIPNDVPARVEFVTCLKITDLMHAGDSLSEIIDYAFAQCSLELEGNEFANNCRGLLHAMDIVSFRERNKRLLTPISNTMKDVIERIFELDTFENIFEVRSDLMVTRSDIEKLYICNAILRFLFRGSFIYGYPTWTRNYLQISETYLRYRSQTPPYPWPFRNVREAPTIELINYGGHQIPKLPPILDGALPKTYETVMTSLWKYRQCNRRNTEDLQRAANELAIAITKLTVISSYRQHEFTAKRTVTLKDLWELHLRNRDVDWKSSSQFFQELYRPGRGITVVLRGIGAVHEHLLIIYKKASDMLQRRYNGQSFHVRCAIEMEKLMVPCTPFRFIFNRIKDIIVLPLGYNGVVPKHFKWVWKTALRKKYKREPEMEYIKRLSCWATKSTDEMKLNIDVIEVMQYMNALRDNIRHPIPFTSNPAFKYLCQYLQGESTTGQPDRPHLDTPPLRTPSPTDFIISVETNDSGVEVGPDTTLAFHDSTPIGSDEERSSSFYSGPPTKFFLPNWRSNSSIELNLLEYPIVNHTASGSSQIGLKNRDPSWLIPVVLPSSRMQSSAPGYSSTDPSSTVAGRVIKRARRAAPTPSTSETDGFPWDGRTLSRVREPFTTD